MTYANLPYNSLVDGTRQWFDEDIVEHIDFIIKETEWFEDADGNLYIFDEEEGDMCAGPDNVTASDIICGLFWASMWNHSRYEVADIVGVTYVPENLRRFTKEDGFYHA